MDTILSFLHLEPIWTILKIVAIMLPLILSVAYATYFERKIIGWMQLRTGPNRVGPLGLIQPFADVVKLLMKEIIIPSKASPKLFIIAPVLVIMPAFAAWAVIPFNGDTVLANIDASLLFIMAITSMGVYGVVIAGWASNSKYAFLGALRSAAQIVSYEIAMGFSLVGIVMLSGSLNFIDIVNSQKGSGVLGWHWLLLFPMFLVYLISGIAETNRAPFDVAEGESEIVAGFHVEYAGTAFAVFFLAEYANMWLICALTSLMFLGGWLSPFPSSWGFIGAESMWWLFAKMSLVMFTFFWLRATFPRYRYDQIMRLGWKVFIPITLVWVAVVGALMVWCPDFINLFKS